MKTILSSLIAGAIALPTAALAQPLAITWSTIDCGGGISSGGTLQLRLTIGQPESGSASGGSLEVGCGYWPSAAAACFPNCDGSTGTPRLTPNDFVCFITAYAAGQSYANCDESTGTPALTPNDFVCFITAYAAGCS